MMISSRPSLPPNANTCMPPALPSPAVSLSLSLSLRSVLPNLWLVGGVTGALAFAAFSRSSTGTVGTICSTCGIQVPLNPCDCSSQALGMTVIFSTVDPRFRIIQEKSRFGASLVEFSEKFIHVSFQRGRRCTVSQFSISQSGASTTVTVD